MEYISMLISGMWNNLKERGTLGSYLLMVLLAVIIVLFYIVKFLFKILMFLPSLLDRLFDD